MLETLLTLIVLSSGSGSADTVQPGSQYYQLELAFEQAQVESVDAPTAIGIEMAQADERVAEAQAAQASGDSAGVSLALASYNYSIALIADDMMSADGLDDEALIQQVDDKLRGELELQHVRLPAIQIRRVESIPKSASGKSPLIKAHTN